LLRGLEFNDFRKEAYRNKIGLIAQEVELVISEVVRTCGDGLKGLNIKI
jgi:hypothetical protein